MINGVDPTLGVAFGFGGEAIKSRELDFVEMDVESVGLAGFTNSFGRRTTSQADDLYPSYHYVLWILLQSGWRT
jgi:hypothetical protein